MTNKQIQCPICNSYIFDDENDFDICSVCGWENDGVQYHDFDYRGGANELSVNEYKLLFKLRYLDSISKDLNEVMMQHDEKMHRIHEKYRHIDYRIDGIHVTQALEDEHADFVSKLLTLDSKIK